MTEVTLDLAPEVEQNLQEYAVKTQMTKKEAGAYLLAIGLDEERDE